MLDDGYSAMQIILVSADSTSADYSQCGLDAGSNWASFWLGNTVLVVNIFPCSNVSEKTASFAQQKDTFVSLQQQDTTLETPLAAQWRRTSARK